MQIVTYFQEESHYFILKTIILTVNTSSQNEIFVFAEQFH